MKYYHVFLLPLAMVVLFVFVGCPEDAPSLSVNNSSGIPPIPPAPSVDTSKAAKTEIDFTDYFPTATGDRWDYEITVGTTDQKPEERHGVYWPNGDKRLYLQSQRYLYEGSGERKFRLSLAVKGIMPTPAFLHYKEAIELKILRDELGYFDDVTHLYWSTPWPGSCASFQVCLYAPVHFNKRDFKFSWKVPGPHVGYSKRLFFYGGEAGTRLISDEANPIERFDIVGIEGDRLHFMRTVFEETDNQKSADPVLNQQITEDLWFEKSVGLLRLAQRVDDKITMNWMLTKFTTGH